MKIAIWKTGHLIADRVAESLARGITSGKICETHNPKWKEILSNYDTNICYGILRGGSDIFRNSQRWFNVDRGYFSPGHYDGYYRISYKGTQAKYDPTFPCKDFPTDYGLHFIKRGGSHILICPPTDHVCDFFGLNYNEWLYNAQEQIKKTGLHYSIRTKDCIIPLEEHLKDCACVVTFNSSVGWKAVQLGIPCLSDTQHSVVGSYYATKSIDKLIEMFNYTPREPLFKFMRNHQFTLAEIEQGNAWGLINHYLKKIEAI